MYEGLQGIRQNGCHCHNNVQTLRDLGSPTALALFINHSALMGSSRGTHRRLTESQSLGLGPRPKLSVNLNPLSFTAQLLRSQAFTTTMPSVNAYLRVCPQPPKGWNYRHMPRQLAWNVFF